MEVKRLVIKGPLSRFEYFNCVAVKRGQGDIELGSGDIRGVSPTLSRDLR
jgi:hypothetical protein